MNEFLYPEKQKDGNWIRNMVFNFPVNGQEVTVWNPGQCRDGSTLIEPHLIGEKRHHGARRSGCLLLLRWETLSPPLRTLALAAY